MKVESKFSNGSEIDILSASAYCSGLNVGKDASQVDQLRAHAYFIATGLCWRIGGWYERKANELLEEGLISHRGIIDYNRLDELNDN